MWKIMVQCMGAEGQDVVRLVQATLDRGQIDFRNLCTFKDQLGYGGQDYYYYYYYYYYNKRIENVDASVKAIDYSKDVEYMLEYMAESEQRKLRLILSKREVVGPVNITPLKRPMANLDDYSTDDDHDSTNDEIINHYKNWLEDQDPDCDLYNDYREAIVKIYSKWLRPRGLLREILAYNRGQAQPTEVHDESNGSSATVPSQWPAHARKLKQIKGGKKMGRGCLKGLAAVAKGSKPQSQKMKINFSGNLGGVTICMQVCEVAWEEKRKQT